MAKIKTRAGSELTDAHFENDHAPATKAELDKKYSPEGVAAMDALAAQVKATADAKRQKSR